MSGLKIEVESVKIHPSVNQRVKLALARNERRKAPLYPLSASVDPSDAGLKATELLGSGATGVRFTGLARGAYVASAYATAGARDSRLFIGRFGDRTLRMTASCKRLESALVSVFALTEPAFELRARGVRSGKRIRVSVDSPTLVSPSLALPRDTLACLAIALGSTAAKCYGLCGVDWDCWLECLGEEAATALPEIAECLHR